MNPEKAISINVKRLRTSRGLSQTAVAEAAKISRQAFIDIENGKTKEPKISNLQAIADVFNVQAMDLLAAPPVLKTVRFRSNSIRTEKDKAKKEQYLIDSAYWLKNFNFLQSTVEDRREYKLRSVSAEIDKLDTAERPFKAADLARRELGLKTDEPIDDITGLIENGGIKIKLLKLQLKGCFGFSILEADGGPAIVVNTDDDISVERRIFTVAHELGHLLMHRHAYDAIQDADNDQEEIEANCFASNFLMPQQAFEKKLKESYGLGFVDRVLHLKRYFGVSYSAVLHRFADMGIADYGQLAIKFNYQFKAKYHEDLKSHKEPFPLAQPDFVEEYLLSLIRKALEAAKITVSRAAEILNVPLIEMREMINSWTEIAA